MVFVSNNSFPDPKLVKTVITDGHPAPPSMPVALEVNLKMRHPDEFNRMMEDSQRPDSPHYMRPFTEEEENKYGPTPSDYEAVERWLRSEGFKISKVYQHPLVRVTCANGTAAQVETALKVQIVQSADGKIFGNTSPPQVPANLAQIVASIGGGSKLWNDLSSPHTHPPPPPPQTPTTQTT